MDNPTYTVSARKYRPSTFASVVGQKALAATLKNSIARDRLAHAYLFCGSRGVGKTSCARIFAKTINCENRTPDGEACNQCDSCRDFNEGRSLNIIELDAASNNSVDDIRTLNDQVNVPPTLGRYRVFIVDEVHMLSSQAFNAFLKTLEEPPSYVIFILATTEKHKIIPTILSRCQIYDFNRITIPDIIDHLAYVASQEGISAEPQALSVIARKADGAMRDALSIFDQVAASSMGQITYRSTIENLNVLDWDYYVRLLEAFLAGNVTDALLIYKEIRDHGFNNHFFINGLADFFRDLMMARDPRTIALLETDTEQANKMAELAAKCEPRFLIRAMELLNDADLHYREAANKQFLTELALIKLCQADGPSPSNSDNGEGLDTLLPLVPVAPTQNHQSAPAPTTPPITPRHAAPQPAAPQTAVHQTAKRPAISGLGPGISIRNPRSTYSADPAHTSRTDSPKRELRSTPYTEAQLQNIWQQYIAANPSAQLLTTAMKLCPPEKIEADHYVITAQSQAQQQTIEHSLGALTEYIRKFLANDHITFTIRLAEGQSTPRTWTSNEVFTHMLSQNPALKELAQTLKLSPE